MPFPPPLQAADSDFLLIREPLAKAEKERVQQRYKQRDGKPSKVVGGR